MSRIDIIKNILSSLKEVEFAYLFGSYAKGDANQNSDIDIAIYIDKNYNTFDSKLKIHHKLEIELHKEIDIIVLNSIKNFDLLQDIFNDGILLKDSFNDARIMYELTKEHEIIDYREFKRILDVA